MHAKLLYVTALYLSPSSVNAIAFLSSSYATLKFSIKNKSYAIQLLSYLPFWRKLIESMLQMMAASWLDFKTDSDLSP